MATTEPVTCQICERSIEQKRGHRKRLYCSDACQQAAYRLRKWKQSQDVTIAVTNVSAMEARIAELEQEVRKLQAWLDLEKRMRADVQVHHFKTWLRTHPQPEDSDFAKRFLADSRLPHHASRSMYEARMRQYGYKIEDIYLFRDAWQTMLLSQS